MPLTRYDTIVVGGGMAGLTSATYLARSGKSVLLIEKNKETGGLVNSFSRDGFVFDSGVRALLDAGIVFPMLQELGIEIEHVRSPVSLGVEDKIINIESIDNLDDYKKLLLELYPESSKDIDALLRSITKIIKHMDVLYGIENPVFKAIPGDRDYLFRKLLPWLPRFALTIGKINRMNMPVEEYLESMINDPSLRDIISQHFFKNTPSFFAMSYFSLYLDYFYPLGGVKSLVDALNSKFLESGGEIKMETIVDKVDANESYVSDNNDNKYYYKHLVWAADLKTFYNITESDRLNAKVKNEFDITKEKMLKRRGGDSVFSVFVEVDAPLESFSEIAHGHFFYTPSRKGLGEIHRGEINDIIANFDKLNKQDILEWLDRFTSLNTFEISLPGLKDPTLVPVGKTGLIVSLLAEYDLFQKIEEAGWYDEFKTEFEDRIIRVLAESVYPVLKDKVIKKFSFSPLSIRDRVNSSEGAIVGWSFQDPVPVVNRIQISDRSVFTPVSNIYQAGQWVYSPAGVPMSILTGRLAADKIIKKSRKRSDQKEYTGPSDERANM